MTIKDYVPPSQMKETGTDLDFVMSGVKHTNVTWWRKKPVNWGLLRAEGILELRPEGCEGADRESRWTDNSEGAASGRVLSGEGLRTLMKALEKGA